MFEGNEILEGDILALSENKVCAIAKNIPDAVDSMLNATGSGENGIITIFYGEDVTEADAEAVHAQTQEKFPDAEVSLVYGGQPIYYYLVSVE